MMQPHIASAVNLLSLVRQQTNAIGVAVSYGKDSLAALDLCCRLFARVEAYYLYRVADMDIVAEWRETVLRRTGVTVRDYPHFDLARCYRHAVLAPHWKDLEVPRVKLTDIEQVFREDANVEWIALGWRATDSLNRAIILKQCRGWDPNARRVFPLRKWRNSQVYDYLDAAGIKRPPTLGRVEQGGLDFNPGALAALSPEDTRRWMNDFPFSGVQLNRPQPEPTDDVTVKGKRASTG